MSLIQTKTLFRYSKLVFETTNRFKSSKLSSQPEFRFSSTNVATENGKQAEETSKSNTSDDVTHLKTEMSKLNETVQNLTEANKILEDKYKRSLADGENLRQRMQKQLQDAKQYGIQSFCKDLLDVSDVLQKAIESVKQDELSNPSLKNLYDGVCMTEKQLQNVFKRHGLEMVNPVDEKFNPNYHEALFQQEVKGKESGIVFVVSKIGYKLHDRCIRPALVGVAK